MKLTRPLCIVDIESTGISPTKDRIVELCVAKYYPDGSKEVKTRLFNPGVPIPAGASKVHGFYDEDVKDCPPFSKVAKALAQFLSGCDVGGFNSNFFDFPMLIEEFHRAGIRWPEEDVQFIDAGVIFKKMEQRTLAAALEFYCGKVLEGAHGAQADTLATYEVLDAQVKLYPELQNSTVSELAIFSKYDNTVDLSGKIILDSEGEYAYNFGKFKGERIKDNPGPAEWMLTNDFTQETKNHLKSIFQELNIYPEHIR